MEYSLPYYMADLFLGNFRCEHIEYIWMTGVLDGQFFGTPSLGLNLLTQKPRMRNFCERTIRYNTDRHEQQTYRQ